MELEMRSLAALTASLAVLLILAGPAGAQTDCVAPPGNAAIEQYCETIPSATGGSGGGATAPTPLEPDARAELRAAGPDGQALAQLLASDGDARRPGSDASPDGASRRDAGKAGDATGAPRGGTGPTATPPAPASNPLGAVSSAIESGPTLGGPFGWAILGLSLLFIGVGWLRLRAPRD